MVAEATLRTSSTAGKGSGCAGTEQLEIEKAELKRGVWANAGGEIGGPAHGRQGHGGPIIAVEIARRPVLRVVTEYLRVALTQVLGAHDRRIVGPGGIDVVNGLLVHIGRTVIAEEHDCGNV